MALTTNEIIQAVSNAYDGADLERVSDSNAFNIKTTPPRQLIFDPKYLDEHVKIPSSLTQDELTAEIKNKKVTMKSARGDIIDLMKGT